MFPSLPVLLLKLRTVSSLFQCGLYKNCLYQAQLIKKCTPYAAGGHL